jgi:DNA-binding CsgD family transcriptional regulator
MYEWGSDPSAKLDPADLFAMLSDVQGPGDPGVAGRAARGGLPSDRRSHGRSIRTPRRSDSLSERELAVLEEIAQGTPTEEVARKLHVSPHTVRTHIKNILRKLDARTRAHAVAIALSEEAIEGLDRDAGQ